MENLSPKKKVTQAGAENRSWGDGGASILPSLILKYSMPSRLTMWDHSVVMNPEGGRGSGVEEGVSGAMQF